MGSPLSILDYRQPVEFRMGDVILRTWNVLSRHFLTFILLVGIADLIPLALGFYLNPSVGPYSSGVRYRVGGSPEMGAAAETFFLAFVQFILTSFAQAIVLYAAFQDLRGRPVSGAESFQRGMARVFPVMVAAVLVGLTEGVGALLCVIPGLIAMAALAVVLPACVVEELGPLQSMSRSNDLTSGHWWPIIGVGAAWLIVTMIGSAVIRAAVPSGTIPGKLLNWAWEVITGSFSAVYAAILYHDLRAVREGIGIDEIASVFD